MHFSSKKQLPIATVVLFRWNFRLLISASDIITDCHGSTFSLKLPFVNSRIRYNFYTWATDRIIWIVVSIFAAISQKEKTMICCNFLTLYLPVYFHTLFGREGGNLPPDLKTVWCDRSKIFPC